VRDVEVREAELMLQVQHELENLRPHAHVEHRHRLVGHEKDRVEDDRARYHGPLLLPARQVRRVLVDELLGRRQPDGLERFGDTLPALDAFGDPVDLEGMPDRLLDRHRRIERGVRILKDDLHASTQTPQVAFRHPRDLLTFEANAALRRRNEPEQRAPKCGLAASRLTHESEDLAAADVEGDVVDGADTS
jgi:hypothetical protein